MITIGIDPHKASLTAVALDATGQQVAARRVTVNAGAFKALMSWAARWPAAPIRGRRRQRSGAGDRSTPRGRWRGRGLGCAGHPGRPGAAAWIPAEPARAIRLTRQALPMSQCAANGSGRSWPRIRQRRLRLLAERRDDLAGERVRVLNRLHVLLRDLLPGGAALDLTANKAAALLRTVRPLTTTDACRRELAAELIADLRRLDRQLVANQAKTREALAAAGLTITDIHGVGTILAGKILGHVGDAKRFPTSDHFASYTGTSPVEASSGEHERHRLNTRGNRQLNAALHTVAVCQARDPGPGRTFYLRKIDEGKTPAEARRALKRRLEIVAISQPLILTQDEHHAVVSAELVANETDFREWLYTTLHPIA